MLGCAVVSAISRFSGVVSHGAYGVMCHLNRSISGLHGFRTNLISFHRNTMDLIENRGAGGYVLLF